MPQSSAAGAGEEADKADDDSNLIVLSTAFFMEPELHPLAMLQKVSDAHLTAVPIRAKLCFVRGSG
jgi:hypothetical protein